MPAALLKLLSLLAMVPGGLKMLGRGAKAAGKATPGLAKAGWGKAGEAASTSGGLAALAGGAYFGNEILNQIGAGKQRDISREELALQEKLAGMSAEATKLLVQESRASTEKSNKESREMRKEDIRRAQDDKLMEMFMGGQDRQMAALLNAMQGMASTSSLTGSSSGSPTGNGMVNVLRSAL